MLPLSRHHKDNNPDEKSMEPSGVLDEIYRAQMDSGHDSWMIKGSCGKRLSPKYINQSICCCILLTLIFFILAQLLQGVFLPNECHQDTECHGETSYCTPDYHCVCDRTFFFKPYRCDPLERDRPMDIFIILTLLCLSFSLVLCCIGIFVN